jgi:hypothetical protein
MKEKAGRVHGKEQEKDKSRSDDTTGYPSYPEDEDIYKMSHKENNINPEEPTKQREPSAVLKAGMNNEKDFPDDMSGDDLDIPGSESDDTPGATASEDEENSYYSLGGDEHNDLEEQNIDL